MTETAQAAPPHETFRERAEGWFHQEAPAAAADLAALARSHAPAIFRLVASLAEKAEAHPEVKALMPEALDALMSAARMAAAAL